MQGASVTFQLSTRIIVSNMCALNDQPGVTAHSQFPLHGHEKRPMLVIIIIIIIKKY